MEILGMTFITDKRTSLLCRINELIYLRHVLCPPEMFYCAVPGAALTLPLFALIRGGGLPAKARFIPASLIEWRFLLTWTE